MLMVDEDKRENQCFVKATRKGEPTFTLRAQDKSAALVIEFWLMLNNKFISQERIQECLNDIEKFLAWPTKKQAD